MFSKSVDKELKKKIYSNLQTNPEDNIVSLKERINKDAKAGKYDEMKDFMKVIKEIIKDKIPSKAKFYALLLLNEIMESKKTQVVEYFIKKMMDRLFKIAQFEAKSKDPNKGQRCLDSFYLQKSKENLDYSLKFFVLLLECWKHWDESFSSSFVKIKEKCDKLRVLFPVRNLYLNQLENLQESIKLERDFSRQNLPDVYGSNSNLPLSMRKLDSMSETPVVIAKQSNTVEFNKDDVKKCITESANFRGNTQGLIVEIDETSFADMFDDFYKETQKLQRQMEAFREPMEKIKSANERFWQSYVGEMDYLNELMDKFDEYSRKNIGFEELVDGLKNSRPRLLVAQETETNNNKGFGFENFEQHVEEKDFTKNNRKKSNENVKKNGKQKSEMTGIEANPFGIDTFGLKHQNAVNTSDSPDEFEGNKNPTGSFKHSDSNKDKFSARDFVDNRINEFTTEQSENRENRFEKTGDQADDFGWNIGVKSNKKITSEFKTFENFQSLVDPLTRKSKSVTQKTLNLENKPAVNFTNKSKFKQEDFSPSTYNRPSNAASKFSDDGKDTHSSLKFPGVTPEPFEDTTLFKKETFGVDGTNEIDLVDQNFKFDKFANIQKKEENHFGFQSQEEKDAFNQNDIFNPKNFKKNDEAEKEQLKVPQFDSIQSRKKMFPSEPYFEQKFNNSAVPESSRSIRSQRNSQNHSYDIHNQSRQNEVPVFEERNFKKKSVFDTNAFKKETLEKEMPVSGRRVGQFEDMEQPEFYDGDELNYQSNSYHGNERGRVEDPDEEHILIEERQASKSLNQRSHRNERSNSPNENYDFAFNENRDIDNRKESEKDRHVIANYLQFSFNPKKFTQSSHRSLKPQNGQKSRQDDDEEQDFERLQMIEERRQRDNLGQFMQSEKSLTLSQKGIRQHEIGNEFDESVQLKKGVEKISDKNITGSVTPGYRMGFTFSGNQKRTPYEERELDLRNKDQLRKNPSTPAMSNKEIQLEKEMTFKKNKIHISDLEDENVEGEIKGQRQNVNLQSQDFLERKELFDGSNEGEMEELKNQNEYYKQQCKLLYEQWSDLNNLNMENENQEKKENKSKSQKQSRVSARMAESEIRNKGVYPSAVMNSESNLSEKGTSKRKQKIELYTKLNENYAMYVEELKRDLGNLKRN